LSSIIKEKNKTSATVIVVCCVLCVVSCNQKFFNSANRFKVWNETISLVACKYIFILQHQKPSLCYSVTRQFLDRDESAPELRTEDEMCCVVWTVAHLNRAETDSMEQ
jgi:hypothetical protein